MKTIESNKAKYSPGIWIKYFSLFLLLFIAPLGLIAQIPDKSNKRYWIDLGVGGYVSNESTEGFSLNMGCSFYHDSSLYKIRVLLSEEFKLFGPHPNESSYELGLMKSITFGNKYLQVVFSGGLGLFGGVKRGDLLYTEPSQGWFTIGDRRHFEADNFIVPSIPIEADFTLKASNNIGVGLTLFGDINYKRPQIGGSVKFSFGRFR